MSCISLSSRQMCMRERCEWDLGMAQQDLSESEGDVEVIGSEMVCAQFVAERRAAFIGVEALTFSLHVTQQIHVESAS